MNVYWVPSLGVVAESLSHVWLFATLWTVACQAPLVHGVFQARILEWVAISFSRGSSPPRGWTHISCTGRQILYHWPTLTAHQPALSIHYLLILRHPDQGETLAPTPQLAKRVCCRVTVSESPETSSKQLLSIHTTKVMNIYMVKEEKNFKVTGRSPSSHDQRPTTFSHLLNAQPRNSLAQRQATMHMYQDWLPLIKHC